METGTATATTMMTRLRRRPLRIRRRQADDANVMFPAIQLALGVPAFLGYQIRQRS